MIKIALLGSTGSIGVQTLEVAARHKERFEIVSLAAGKNVRAFFNQLEKFAPAVGTLSAAPETEKEKIFSDGEGAYYRTASGKKCRLYFGEDAFLRAIVEEADVVVVALVGFVGVKAVLKAAEAGKKIALANKESLVVGGELVMRAVEKAGVELAPVDSEHSAIWQALGMDRHAPYKKIILTASGGAFRDKTAKELESVTAEQALKHPNWNMGGRITVDCATMVNKGFEVIEAMRLYGAKAEQVEVVIHPQSVIHSMVEFEDNAVLAQLSYPTMELPIQLALCGERLNTACEPLDFVKLGALTFLPVDEEKYPCFYLTLESMRMGDNYPCALNAADEVAVAAFLQGKIRFTDIAKVLKNVLDKTSRAKISSLSDLVREDALARRLAEKAVTEIHGTSIT